MAKVLIIDDDEGSRTIFAGLLRLEGYQAATAETGHAGIRLALREHPDVILVDLHLPDMSGVDVVRELVHAHGVVAPVVLMTVFPDFYTPVNATAAGAAGYVESFLSLDQLLDVVFQALNGDRPVTHPDCSLSQPDERRQPPSSPHAPGLPLDQRLTRVIRLVDSERGTQWSVRTLARQVRLSESRLRHLFAAVLGLPLSKFVQHRRLLRAARLLLTTRHSIETVAARVHLPVDPRAVRAAFRKRFGMLPGSYRRRFWSPTSDDRSL